MAISDRQVLSLLNSVYAEDSWSPACTRGSLATVGGTVRDFLGLLSIIGIVVGGFWSFRNHFKNQHQEIHQRIATTRSSSLRTTVRKNHKNKLGDSQHESTNYRSNEQDGAIEQGSGASGEITESDKLPDLYEAEEFAERSSVEGDSEELASPEQSQGTSVIAGVPVAAWVRAHKNKVKDTSITPPTQQNLRVYFGCLELKKGAQTTEKHVCEKLLTSRDSKLVNERERY